METIKNYLDAMFANMPGTPTVQKAKSELLQMMEDKYNELIALGESENSAVGTVISEFGNLDELAEDLGIKNEVDVTEIKRENAEKKLLSLEETKEFLRFKSKSALMVGLGVLLCIMCVDGIMLGEAIKASETVGISLMFLMIAVAVGLFVFNGIIGEKWQYLKKVPCQIDMTTTAFLTEEKNRYRTTHALCLTIGIVLCVICWLPTVIFGQLGDGEIGVILLFAMVGIGVFMIIYSNMINSSFDNILYINRMDTMKGKYVKEHDIEYINDNIKIVMELFWPVVTTIYLAWSFLTFEWWRTWIIWPVAAICHFVLKKFLRKR